MGWDFLIAGHIVLQTNIVKALYYRLEIDELMFAY